MILRKIMQVSLLTALLTLLPQSYLHAQYSEKIDFDKRYRSEELISDINYMLERYEAIHPNLYAFVGKDLIMKERDRVVAKIDKPMTRYEFAKKIIPLVSLFKEGHTYMIFPFNEEDAYSNSGGTYFPLEVVIRENRIFVKSSYSADRHLKPGMEILSINGVDGSQLLSLMAKYVTGDKEAQRIKRVEMNFKRFLRILFDMEKDFAIDYSASMNDKPRSIRLAGVTLNEIVTQRKELAKEKRNVAQFRISMDTKGAIAMLTIDTLRANMKAQYENFLAESFTRIRDGKIENLIIDIRQNRGGSIELANRLFDYIYDKPYSFYDKVEFRLSSEVLNHKRFSKFFETDDFKKHRKGDWVYWEKIPKVPQNSDLLFKGNLYLLTSGETYAAADDFAAVFKCYKMGTVIGEETGGAGVTHGEIIMLILPNTKIPAYVSSKKIVQPCAKINRGTIPHHLIKERDKNLTAGDDAVVTFAYSLTKKS